MQFFIARIAFHLFSERRDSFLKVKMKAVGRSICLGFIGLFMLVLNARAEMALTTMVTFDWTNGCYPECGLTLGKDGNFYGAFAYGGWFDDGTIFRMSPDGICDI